MSFLCRIGHHRWKRYMILPKPKRGPDLDKLQRAIGDALTKSRVITDDARIVHWNIRKVWADNMPGMDIEIAEIRAPDGPKNPGI